MSKAASRIIQSVGLSAALLMSASLTGFGWAQQRELAQMCKHKDYQTCIRDACGPPAPPGPPVSGNQKYVPSAAEVQQDACYKTNTEPCRAANNCPH